MSVGFGALIALVWYGLYAFGDMEFERSLLGMLLGITIVLVGVAENSRKEK